MCYNKYIASFILLFSLLLSPLNGLLAQEKKAKNNKAVSLIEISATVVDEQGEKIKNAEVIIGEGALTYYTNAEGKFSAKLKPGAQFIVEANGYESQILEASPSLISGSKIVLTKAPLFSGAKDSFLLPGGIKDLKRYNIGAVSRITGSDLESYPTMGIGNALQGKLMGLMVDVNTGGSIGTANSSIYIRGLHRISDNGIVTLIDGVERSINTLTQEEIETIEVLKDPTTKILYGPRAANGVLSITTKKGAKHKKIVKATAEFGVGMASDVPEFLDSYNYAKLYNEARINDGLAPIYSNADLDGYRQSTGANDFRYPNTDYYDYYLKNNNQYGKASLELSGGNEGIQYSFIGGYIGLTGLDKIGDTPMRNRFNARGNLDIKINDFISSTIGISVVFDQTNRNALSGQELVSSLSSTRPNEYSLFVPESIIPADSVGYPNLGTSIIGSDNLYGTLKYGGYQKDQSISGQLDFALKFDLNKFVEGLSAVTQVSFDNYFSGSEVLTTNAPTYSQKWFKTPDGRDSLIMIQKKKSNKNDKVTLPLYNTYRTTSFKGLLSYSKNINDKNKLDANYLFNYYLGEQTGNNQDTKFLNNVLKLSYINQDRYIVDASVGYMGNNKFYENNKYATSYALGLGWIISEESFLNSISQIDYLKLKASAGVLPFDGTTENDLYLTQWNNTGSARLNDVTNPSRTNIQRIGNPDLKWEKATEMNVGFEALVLNKRLWLEANYFYEKRTDMIMQVNSAYSSMHGNYYPYSNWGRVANQGIEAEFKFSDRSEDLSYQIGANITYSKNKVLKSPSTPSPYDYLNPEGKPSDAMFGYVANGLFGRDVDLASSYPQSFGAYQNGDIAYQDLNGDKRIDEFDQRSLSNSFPRVHLGIDVNLFYKGFGLYILGTSSLGYSNWLNTRYFWNTGEDKYSDLVLDRYHAINNPQGKYPRLTTTSGPNNFRNSSYWIEKGDFFKIKNVEFSYTFHNKSNSSIYKKLKLFVKGTNLICFSAAKDYDPETLNAGLTTYPILKNIVGGVSVSF